MVEKDSGRRSDVRVKAKLKVRFKSVSAFISEYTHNISKGGLFIRTGKPCALRDRVEVVLVLPESEKEVSILGEVMHVVPPEQATDDTPAGMGLQITEIKAEDVNMIESFIQKRLEEEGVDGLGRREHIRHPSRLRVKFGSKQALVEEYIHNISHGGIFIQTTKPRSIHEQLDIILIHPLTNEEIKLAGEVVRIVTKVEAKKNPRLKSGMGIRFVELDDYLRSEIDRFIGDEARKSTGATVKGK
jgi:uncharacterized protein (TIGR02266 family)